ncbi:hypothetical protein [Arsenophonus nasoniae]|uniref:hypothetical protein n=1 Tax=Arsenophonus nasoniae TaxID=638 RepID=UPI0038792CFF
MASIADPALQTRLQKMGCRLLGRIFSGVVAMIATSVSSWFSLPPELLRSGW